MGVWGVIVFVLSAMHAVGGVPSWVACVCVSLRRRRVSVSAVHPAAIPSAGSCVI